MSKTLREAIKHATGYCSGLKHECIYDSFLQTDGENLMAQTDAIIDAILDALIEVLPEEVDVYRDGSEASKFGAGYNTAISELSHILQSAKSKGAE